MHAEFSCPSSNPSLLLRTAPPLVCNVVLVPMGQFFRCAISFGYQSLLYAHQSRRTDLILVLLKKEGKHSPCLPLISPCCTVCGAIIVFFSTDCPLFCLLRLDINGHVYQSPMGSHFWASQHCVHYCLLGVFFSRTAIQNKGSTINQTLC